MIPKDPNDENLLTVLVFRVLLLTIQTRVQWPDCLAEVFQQTLKLLWLSGKFQMVAKSALAYTNWVYFCFIKLPNITKL